jgi:spore maturation protein CgeB
VRLFEAGACGCPVLSDAWNGLETLFEPGREIVICKHAGDVLAALDMPEATRRATAKAYRRRVLNEHTGEHRARELENYLLSARREHASRLPAEIGESVA